MLARFSRMHGERLFTVYEDERVSFEAAFRATAALAAELQRLGIGKGDRVALAMANLPEWPVAFFAITALGAIAVPLNAWWTGRRARIWPRRFGREGADLRLPRAVQRIAPHRESLAGARACPRQPRRRGAGRARPARGPDRPARRWGGLPDADLPDVAIAPDDEATILYTSGTTGRPKGALGTHRNLLTNILSSGYVVARAALRRGETPPEPEPQDRPDRHPAVPRHRAAAPA